MLVAVGFSSSMMLSLVDWSYYGKCIEEGLSSDISDADRTCTDIIPQAFACSCVAEWKIQDDYAEDENIIFSGTVTDIITQERSYLVTLDIIDSWKGIPVSTDKINIMTSQSSASCGVSFEQDQSYLVVGFGSWDQTPTVSSCSSTTLLDFADPQVAYLNDVSPKPKENADSKFLPPLKQYNSGSAFHEIQCREGFQKTQRYDGAPACVKSDTYWELIKRNWVSNIIKAVQSRDASEMHSSYMDKVIPTLDDFRNTLKESADIEVIFSKFGQPHDDIGSGIHIYEYILNDSTKIWIWYSDVIQYVRHVDTDGKILEEIYLDFIKES